MAFTFTVEDGTGLPNANSYVSVSDADDILITNIHNTAWTALNTTNKEYLLAWATRILDNKMYWYGKKAFETSALKWPRTGVVDLEGIEVPDDQVPLKVKEATAEMARYLIAGDRTTEQPRDGLKELKVDVIEIVFDESYRLASVPKFIWEILNGYGRLNSTASGFPKIIKT